MPEWSNSHLTWLLRRRFRISLSLPWAIKKELRTQHSGELRLAKKNPTAWWSRRARPGKQEPAARQRKERPNILISVIATFYFDPILSPRGALRRLAECMHAHHHRPLLLLLLIRLSLHSQQWRRPPFPAGRDLDYTPDPWSNVTGSDNFGRILVHAIEIDLMTI
jgi:hypothetical protein